MNTLVMHGYQLREIRIDKLSFIRYSEEVPESPEGLKVSVDTNSEAIDETNGLAFLTINLDFDPSSQRLFSLELNLRGECIREPGADEEEFAHFLSKYSVPLLWPFAREIVWNSMVRMGFPPLVLSTINIHKTLEASSDPQVCSEPSGG